MNSSSGKRTSSDLSRRRAAAHSIAAIRTEAQNDPAIGKLGLAALGAAMAFAGQSVLIEPPYPEPELALRQWIAGVLLVGGALVFGFATLRRPDSPGRPEAEAPQRAAGGIAGFVMSPGMAAAVLISAAAMALFALSGESWIVRFGWLAGMLMLLFSQLWRERPMVGLSLRKEGAYLLLLILILAVSALVGSYRLDVLPLNFDGDFGTWGIEARRLLTGTQDHIFGLAWGGEPIISTLATALALWLVGDSLVGVNAAGILGGLLSILGTYLLARELFSARLAVMAAALLGASYAYMAASRQAHFIDPVPLLTFTIYFLIRGIRQDRAWAIVSSGLLAGLCFQMYFSGRTVLLIFAFLVLYLLLFRRTLLLTRLGLLGLWLLSALIAIGPMIIVFARDYEGFMARTQVVFILSPPLVKHMMGVYQVDTLWEMLLQQARHTAFMFYYYGDTGTQFGVKRAFLDAITAPLFTLGLAYAVVHWRRLSSALLIGWVGVVVLAGGFLTGGPPNWPRLFVVLPAAAILAALALDLMYRLVDPPLRQISQSAKVVAPVVVLLLIAWIGIRNWNTYVEAKGSTASTRTRIARHMLAQPPGTVGYMVSEHYRIQDREFEFLIPGRLLGDLTPEQVREGVVSGASPTLLILTRDQDALVTELPDLYPGGDLLPLFGDRPDQVEFHVFRLPSR